MCSSSIHGICLYCTHTIYDYAILQTSYNKSNNQQSYLTGREFVGNDREHNPEHIELETELTIDVQSLNKFTSLKVGVAFIPDSPIGPILPLTPGSPIGPISPSAP